jgi:hypothetical protein
VNLVAIRFESIHKLANDAYLRLVGWREASTGGRNEDVSQPLANFAQFHVRILQRAGAKVSMNEKDNATTGLRTLRRNVCVDCQVLATERVIAGRSVTDERMAQRLSRKWETECEGRGDHKTA